MLSRQAELEEQLFNEVARWAGPTKLTDLGETIEWLCCLKQRNCQCCL